MNAVVMSPQPIVAADQIMSVIAAAASDPNVNVDKLERLFALHEKFIARQAEIAFNEALTKVQASMPAVLKDSYNEQTRSTYAKLEAVNAKVVPVATAAGFSLSFSEGTDAREGCVRIQCQLAHSAGHSRTYHVDVPLDATGMKGTANKTQTHAFGSTVSYGRRYLTLMIFNVAVQNEDTDGNKPKADVIPDNYESWKADMTAVAENGIEPLHATWLKSDIALRNYALKTDREWWEKTKEKAKGVKA